MIHDVQRNFEILRSVMKTNAFEITEFTGNLTLSLLNGVYRSQSLQQRHIHTYLVQGFMSVSS